MEINALLMDEKDNVVTCVTVTKVTTVKVPYPVNQSDHNIGQFGVFLGFGSNRA